MASKMASHAGPYVADGKSMTVDTDYCMQSLPCHHSVVIDGVEQIMSANHIYPHMLKSGKKVHPHFLYMQFWVNLDGSMIDPVDRKAYRAWRDSGAEQRAYAEYEKANEDDVSKLQ